MLLNSTQVPNTLLKAIIEHEFTEKEVAFLLFLCRKTIGWNEETQWMTRQYIQTALAVSSENHVSELVMSLEKKLAIKRIPNPQGSGWLFSLNEKRWGLEHEIEESTNQDSKSPEIGTHSITIGNQVPGDFQKSQKIEVLDEEMRTRSKPKFPNKKTVSSWFPFQEKSWLINTTECSHMELLHERGKEAVCGIIKFCLANESDTYFPAWRSPSLLERNRTKIQAFANRNGL